MLNKAFFIGNLTRDVEFKSLPSGVNLAKGSLASTTKYKTQNGDTREEVCYMEFTIFGGLANVAHQYLKKGSKVHLEGKIIFEQWTGQDNKPKSKHTLRVDEMIMLDSKPQSSNNTNQGNYQNNQNNQRANNNTNQGNYQSNQQNTSNHYEGLNEDEIDNYF